MSQRPFRFLHAADLHLDQPISGVAEVPDHLVDLLIDAPLRAAARVFDVAIDRHVDFVVLSGDLIDWSFAAPREVLFLVEQFERLADRNIDVYWATSPIDRSGVKSLPQWPRNVRLFPAGRIERYRHEVSGAAVCEIIGRSHAADAPARPYDFAPTDANLFSLAVTHSDWNCGPLGEIGARYWALGGRHERCTPLEVHSVAHYPGTHQGRRPEETGPHGCTLVDVDAAGCIQLAALPCDVVRCHAPAISFSDVNDRNQMHATIAERTLQLLTESGSTAAPLVSWRVTCSGSALGHAELTAALLARLRKRFADRTPPTWIVDLQVLPPDELPEAWHDEDSICGDFMRAIRTQLTDDPQTTASLPLIAPDDVPAGARQALGWGAFSLEQPEARRRVLQEAAWLGADLLSPTERAS